MKAATTSLVVRTATGHPLAKAFTAAHDEFLPIYVLAAPAMQAGATGVDASRDSYAQIETFRNRLDEALICASEAIKTGEF